VKDAKDFKVIGKPHHRVDAIQKVTGAAKYAGDYKFPGMLLHELSGPHHMEQNLYLQILLRLKKLKGSEL